jgi:ABC-type phosphate transport system substrate-binding protein
MKKKKLIALAVCSIGMLFLGNLLAQAPATAPPPSAKKFMVVVHNDNKVTSLSRDDVAKLFIGQVRTWDKLGYSAPVEPVDQVEDSEVRAAFTEAIHKTKVSAIKSYWQRMIFSGRGVPPPEVEGDRKVLDHVASRPGGIGYVAANTKLESKVKELEVKYE